MSITGYTRPMRRHRIACAVLLAAVSLLATGCLTRHVREEVFDQDRMQVFLRTDKRLFSTVQKGYDHPATISAVRIAHILSRIDLRWSAKEGNQRAPAIPTELLYPMADGVSQALAKAAENQEVVVMGIRKQRRFAILDDQYLTSLILYVRADKLYVHLSHSDYLLKESYRPGEKLPQPRLSDDPGRFRLYGGEAMTLIASNAMAVHWRDPIFKVATRTKILPTGEVKRKTILLESPAEDVPEGEDEGLAEPVSLPSGLTPAQLRELADLEEARLEGRVTESEYRIRQREILGAE